MGGAMADFDLDGLDGHLRHQRQAGQFLFHNQGGGKFEEVAFPTRRGAARRTASLISGMGVDFRDIDNDGYPDIVFVALDNETFPLFRNTGRAHFRGRHRTQRHARR